MNTDASSQSLPPPILPPSELPPPILPPANTGTSGTANFGDVAAAQAYSTSSNATVGVAGANPMMGASLVGGGPGGMAAAGNQNYYGSIVQV